VPRASFSAVRASTRRNEPKKKAKQERANPEEKRNPEEEKKTHEKSALLKG
jgi:hypothetical protein